MAVAPLKSRCLSQHCNSGIFIYVGAKNWSPLLRAVPTVAFEELSTAHPFGNAAAMGGGMLCKTQAVAAPAKFCAGALKISPVSFLMII